MVSKNVKRISFLVLFSLIVGTAVFLFTSPGGKNKDAPRIEQAALSKEDEPIITIPSPTTKLPPTAIRIDKLDKSLPISAALVHDNEWDIFDNQVSWLSTSAIPGEGNVILYAHDRPEMFGDLNELEIGDIVEVLQSDEWRQYVVREIRSVTPSDVTAILSENNQLTLYTCEGSFDQKRLVVYADPKD